MNYPIMKKTKFRDVNSVIKHSERGFEYAYAHGVMGLKGRPGAGRAFVLKDGRRIVDFARGSYLGLDNHPKIIEGAVKALTDYGVLQCNTARTRLNLDISDELEYRLSDLFQARTILSSLVLTANMAVLPLIASGAFTEWEPPLVVFDKLAHATLTFHKPVMAEDTEVITCQHNDLHKIESLCKTHKRVAYILDGVYSMGGHAPMEDLLYLQDKYGLFLYIDDAHGTSVYGQRGEGFARQFIGGELGDRTIIAASLGKAFGAGGAALMLGNALQEQLITRYGVPYAFAIGPNVATIGAALASVDIHNSAELGERQRRLRNILERFDAAVPTEQSGSITPIRMIKLGAEQSAIDCADWLLNQGYYLTAAFYPTVARDNAGLRLCLTSEHTAEQIDEAAHLIAQWKAGQVRT